MTNHLTVEPGRNIYRDGQPFVSVGREGNTRPVDADSFTHLAALAPEMLALVRSIAESADPRRAMHAVAQRQEWVEAARALLARLDEKETKP